jgi:hypothetical protein
MVMVMVMVMPGQGHVEFGMAREFNASPAEAAHQSEDTPGAKRGGRSLGK